MEELGPIPRPPLDDNAGRWKLVTLILALAAASVAYRLLHWNHLEQTAALFIGLPTLLALVTAMMPRARSPLGIILKGLTIGLLMSGIVLGEGFICILMAAPLFYLVGLIVGLVLNRQEKSSRGRLYALLLFLPASLEGTQERLSFERDEVVGVERVVMCSPADVVRRLGETPRFDRPLPLYLRLGFPRPGRARGSGLAPGDRRVIPFEAGAMSGALVLQVSESEGNRVVFYAASDSSPIAGWLDWRQAEVRWEELAPGRTRVTWTARYTRRLDPAWYFAPWERYAVRLAMGYLADTITTP
jgi:hypothetical protein